MHYNKKLLCTVKYSSEWPVEINEVSWSPKMMPQLDIRSWAPSHERMSKGIHMTDVEAFLVVRELLKALINRNVFKEEDVGELSSILLFLDKHLIDAEKEIPDAEN
jgi:hypothetical protein